MPPFPQPATARPAPSVPWPSRGLSWSSRGEPCSAPIDSLITDMVRTRGGSHYRPRDRFSIQDTEDPDTIGAARAHSPNLPAVEQPAIAPVAVPEEPQGFRRYQTRMGPRAPSPVPKRRSRRARPSKRGPDIKPAGVLVILASAITLPSRGELIALSIAGFEDQAAIVRRDPDSGERRAPRQGLSRRVVL